MILKKAIEKKIKMDDRELFQHLQEIKSLQFKLIEALGFEFDPQTGELIDFQDEEDEQEIKEQPKAVKRD